MEQLKVYAATLEEKAEAQIREMSQSDAYGDCLVRIMPDCHAGAGCTIGTVISLRDRIVPNTVGVDIGCGMLVVHLGKGDIDLQRLDRVVNNEIPSGFNIHEKPVEEALLINRLHCRETIDSDIAQRSIGSLGGGNHFIEVDEGSDGEKYLVIHSGSRNLGKRVCEYWQKRAEDYCSRLGYDEQAIIARLKAEGHQREISAAIREAKEQAPKIDKEMAFIEDEDAEKYLYDMQLCQMYANTNRYVMSRIICDAMGWMHMNIANFTTIHNYIDIKHRILRKGAVRALNGERLIIPMNMRDGSLICRGRGNIDWLYSAPHGAGRLMSRKQAQQTVSLDEFRRSMEGIYSTSVCAETIDESPMAYKPMQEIVSQIADTVDVVDVIKPIYNFKAKTPEKPDWKALKHKLPKAEDSL
ncbi:MAG: RtcB family protein [Prevotella sp.]|nr:RtcB family protein [Prevotella sp.]